MRAPQGYLRENSLAKILKSSHPNEDMLTHEKQIQRLLGGGLQEIVLYEDCGL